MISLPIRRFNFHKFWLDYSALLGIISSYRYYVTGYRSSGANFLIPHSTILHTVFSVTIRRHDKTWLPVYGERGLRILDTEGVDRWNLFVFSCPDRYVLLSNEKVKYSNDENQTCLTRSRLRVAKCRYAIFVSISAVTTFSRKHWMSLPNSRAPVKNFSPDFMMYLFKLLNYVIFM